jgi:hypothetical protein
MAAESLAVGSDVPCYRLVDDEIVENGDLGISQHCRNETLADVGLVVLLGKPPSSSSWIID